MIDPLPIKVKYSDKEMLKQFSHITYSDDADITINDPQLGRYNIFLPEEKIDIEGIDEVWVKNQTQKINLASWLDIPIIVLTENKELLPYCMKDRLAYLQDKINKEKGRYG